MADKKLEFYILRTRYRTMKGSFFGEKELNYYTIFGPPEIFEHPADFSPIEELAKKVMEKNRLNNHYISDINFYFNKPANIPDIELRLNARVMVERKELTKPEIKKFLKSLEEVLSKHD